MSDAQNFKLIIEDDQGRRSVVPVDLTNVSIGRLETNTIRLNERNVSRQHARLARENGSVVAEDLGSYNGVWVNGDRIRGRQPVRDGDLIRIGDFQLEIRSEAVALMREETTQRTQVDTEATQTDVRVLEPTNVFPIAPPLTQSPLPAPAPAARPSPSKPEPTPPPPRAEATAIIRFDTVEGAAAQVQALASNERAKLLCISSHFPGREFVVTKSDVVIGRTEENDIVVDHRSVSRNHARIQVQAGRYRLIDLQSANGTLVNGEQYTQTELKKGDLVELGHVRFRFVPPGESYHLSPEEAAGKGKGSKRGFPLKLVGGAVGALLLVGFGAVLATRGKGSNNQAAETIIKAPPPSDELSELIAKAQVALGQRRWQQAADLAGAALGQSPNDPSAKQILEQATLESNAQKHFEEATEALGRSDYGTAWRALRSLPETSVYKAQSVGILGQIKGGLIAELASKARGAIDDEDFESAEGLAGEIAALDSSRAEPGQIRAEIERAQGADRSKPVAKAKTPPRRETKPAPPVATVTPPPQLASPPVAAAAGPATAKQLYQEGVEAFGRSNLNGAIDAWSRCVQTDSSFDLCYRSLGIAYARSGNGAKAARYYKQYLRVNPNAQDADQVRKLLEQYETSP